MSSKKKYRENFKKAVKMEIREHKSSFAVYMIIRSIVFLVMIRQAFNGNYENVFMCILTLLLLTVPSFIQVRFRIELPKTLEIIILLFIFSAEILGEVNEFYLKIPYWDTILHTLNGFLAAAIGFSLVDLLNSDDRLVFNLSPFFVAVVGVKQPAHFEMRVFILDFVQDVLIKTGNDALICHLILLQHFHDGNRDMIFGFD